MLDWEIRARAERILDLLHYRRRLRTAARLLRHQPGEFLTALGVGRLPRRLAAARARRYLNANDVTETLVRGRAGEFSLHDAKLVDIERLHRLVRRLRPRHVVEFGCGFSTLAMAHALYLNARQWPGEARGTLHVMEASEQWGRNLEQKIPAELAPFVKLRVQSPEVQTIAGQLCHAFPQLPNVRPDLIYLDGPDPRDVKGEVCGLSFADGAFACAADPLLYEWFLYPGFVMVVDGRLTNVEFLRRNLKRKYAIRQSWLHGYTVFELLR
jgi:Methyltransferase domain